MTIGDILKVVLRFGANDDNGATPINRNTDPLSTPPPAPAYHPAFDRGNSLGPNVWNLDAADGAISIGDINATVNQFGHSCIPAP